MALSIDKVHARLDYLINKSKWGYTSPRDKDLALDLAQIDLFNFYYGDPNKYQYGRPIPPVAHGQNQKLHDALSPFLTPIELSSPDGFTVLPSDYVHLDSAYLIDYDLSPETYTPLKLVSNDKVAFKQNSQLNPVHINSGFENAFISLTPSYSTGENGIQMYPREDPYPVVPIAYYLRRPAAPLYSYEQTGRDITYIPASSIQLEWSDDNIQKIIQSAIQYIGINLENGDLFQEGQIKEKS